VKDNAAWRLVLVDWWEYVNNYVITKCLLSCDVLLMLIGSRQYTVLFPLKYWIELNASLINLQTNFASCITAGLIKSFILLKSYMFIKGIFDLYVYCRHKHCVKKQIKVGVQPLHTVFLLGICDHEPCGLPRIYINIFYVTWWTYIIYKYYIKTYTIHLHTDTSSTYMFINIKHAQLKLQSR
jgi:hypothetical protein